jgi:Na+-driven multidrug efflux pump
MNIRDIKIRDASGWTMLIFGVLAFLLGLVGLIRPEILLSLLGFETIDRAQRIAGDYTIVFMMASSMASFNMGVYYIFAAINDVKMFYRWTVPFRILTFVVFTAVVIERIAPINFLGVGVWELLGAISTGIALYTEDRKIRETPVKESLRKKKIKRSS